MAVDLSRRRTKTRKIFIRKDISEKYMGNVGVLKRCATNVSFFFFSTFFF